MKQFIKVIAGVSLLAVLGVNSVQAEEYDSNYPSLRTFSWYLEDVMYNGIPSNVTALHSFEEIEGEWKMLIAYDNGAILSFMNASIDGTADSCDLTVDWYYTYDGYSGNGFYDKAGDSHFYGSMSRDNLYTTGPGNVRANYFYQKDGNDYIVGIYDSPDGTPATVALVRESSKDTAAQAESPAPAEKEKKKKKEAAVEVSEEATAEELDDQGRLAYYGFEEEQDFVKAAKLFTKAAKQGETAAYYNLGVCYFFGEGVDQNMEKAYQLFKKAASEGDEDAEFFLGYICETASSDYYDMETCVKWYQKAAEHGSPDAQRSLGYMYEVGANPITGDIDQAVYWYTKAAEQDLSHAQMRLANLYRYSYEIGPDLEAAVDWYTEAYLCGDPEGLTQLGNILYNNELGEYEPDYELAFQFYQEAAALGNMGAYYNIAECYRYGNGVEADEEIASQYVAEGDRLAAEAEQKHDPFAGKVKLPEGYSWRID